MASAERPQATVERRQQTPQADALVVSSSRSRDAIANPIDATIAMRGKLRCCYRSIAIAPCRLHGAAKAARSLAYASNASR
jgi:hypothetical protein